MSRIEFDTSELNRLAVDLSRAPGRMQRKAPKVLEVAANKIKKGMRADAEDHNYLKGLPRTINYDRLGALDYEIGYDKVEQGKLANIAAFGSINNAPVLDLEAPMRREIPHVVRALGDAGEESALGGDAQR